MPNDNEKLLAAVSGIPESAGGAASVENSASGTPSDSFTGNEENAVSGEVASVVLKRGRHKKGCVCGRCVQSIRPVKTPGANAGVAVSKPVAPLVEQYTDAERAFAKEAIRALTHTADSLAILWFSAKLKKGGADDVTVDYAKSKLLMAEPTRTGIIENGVVVAEKYRLLKLLPEYLLLIHVGTYASALLGLNAELSKYFKANPIPAKAVNPPVA